MKLKNSLFIKIAASIMLVVMLAVAGFGVVGILYLVESQNVLSDSYLDSNDCNNKMWRRAQTITDYYQLKLEIEKSDNPTYNQEENLNRYETLLGLREAGNFVWQLYSEEGSLLASNLLESDGEDIAALTGSFQPQKMDMTVELGLVDTAEIKPQRTTYHIVYGLRSDLPYRDEFYNANKLFGKLKPLLAPAIVVTIAAFLFSIVLFSYLVASAGRKEGEEKVVLNPFDKIWLEPLLLITLLVVSLVVMSASEVILCLLMGILAAAWVLIVMLSVVRRAKAGCLYSTTFIHLILRFFRIIVRHVHISLRVAGILCVYLLIQLLIAFALTRGSFMAGLIWFLSNVSVMVIFILMAIQYDQIRKATEKMAAGELGKVVNENAVPLFHTIARNLNSTGVALNKAVERATSSERMKTELITNVSHDIKTPLTSIISYVGLLKTTHITDPKAMEYIDVLERKSKRLGQLMADLVEASKVTSGNVTVNMEVINLGELVKQAGGEFESRMEERGIILMCHLPEQPVMVMADGRHMWRVLDNLFGNAVKYALDGTRVYVDLAVIEKDVILSVKNISRDPLNIRPDELMERFVRGDASRNTEGSGLGLSIARSLMELQSGRMDIQIDGDLFKVILTMRNVETKPLLPEK